MKSLPYHLRAPIGKKNKLVPAKWDTSRNNIEIMKEIKKRQNVEKLDGIDYHMNLHQRSIDYLHFKKKHVPDKS
jgi:hypothetical protein